VWVWERHVGTVICSPFFDEEKVPTSQHEEVALRCYCSGSVGIGHLAWFG
jgi:hypothetical protein